MSPENKSDVAVTRHVAAFIADTRASALPADVIALGKKSILDGLGLALSGSIAKSRYRLRFALEKDRVVRKILPENLARTYVAVPSDSRNADKKAV